MEDADELLTFSRLREQPALLTNHLGKKQLDVKRMISILRPFPVYLVA